MMKVLIDTNVILDYLADRAPFAESAVKVMELCGREEIIGVLTASAATDVYYILRKATGAEKARNHLRLLFSVLDIAEVGKNDLLRCLELGIADFEDALLAQCAKRVKAEFIITRDLDGFVKSPVPPILPADFICRFFPE